MKKKLLAFSIITVLILAGCEASTGTSPAPAGTDSTGTEAAAQAQGEAGGDLAGNEAAAEKETEAEPVTEAEEAFPSGVVVEEAFPSVNKEEAEVDALSENDKEEADAAAVSENDAEEAFPAEDAAEEAFPAGEKNVNEDTAGAEDGSEESLSLEEEAEEAFPAGGNKEDDAAAEAEEKKSENGQENGSEEDFPKEDAPAEQEAAGAARQADKEEEKEEEPEVDLSAYEANLPAGYSPCGVYNLVYSSGAEVKARCSQAGMTYYYGSEEINFVLNKDLPPMNIQTAHLFFGTPVPPAQQEAEFTYDEPYTLYVSLDSGASYQVYRDQLDLEGRIFISTVFEEYRKIWEQKAMEKE